MNPDTRVCPKCEGEMDKGQLKTPKTGVWVKGKTLTTFSAIKGTPTWTYRCSKCGYMEMWSD